MPTFADNKKDQLLEDDFGAITVSANITADSTLIDGPETILDPHKKINTSKEPREKVYKRYKSLFE